MASESAQMASETSSTVAKSSPTAADRTEQQSIVSSTPEGSHTNAGRTEQRPNASSVAESSPMATDQAEQPSTITGAAESSQIASGRAEQESTVSSAPESSNTDADGAGQPPNPLGTAESSQLVTDRAEQQSTESSAPGGSHTTAESSRMAAAQAGRQPTVSSEPKSSTGQDTASLPSITSAPRRRILKNRVLFAPTSQGFTPAEQTHAATPPTSADSSAATLTTADPQSDGNVSGKRVKPRNEKYFKSRRIQKGTAERPWLTKKDPRDKWNTIIPLIGLVIGLGVCAFLLYDGIQSVAHNKYCSIFEDDFSTGFNSKNWVKEVEVGGFGNGEFQQTTDSDENVSVKNGLLYIKPTLQHAALVENDHVIDLRDNGCTGRKWEDCVTGTNRTNGTIVNPVKSARINTKLSASIKFGRVEVVAKLPAGDWLWPTIRMLPSNQTYGGWPRSGEIDIAQSRGNDWTYAQGGNNIVSSALHFGPDLDNDGWWRNNVKRRALHSSYASEYNTFGVEWSEKYIFTYVNTRLLQVLFTQFAEPFWTYGRFPLADRNGSRLENPWAHTGSKASPFDQDFYLVLDVAVGGTDGWFEDGRSGKPWIDSSSLAKRDFWQTRDEWYPTWKEQGWMEVQSVKMWQQEGYNGCTPEKSE